MGRHTILVGQYTYRLSEDVRPESAHDSHPVAFVLEGIARPHGQVPHCDGSNIRLAAAGSIANIGPEGLRVGDRWGCSLIGMSVAER